MNSPDHSEADQQLIVVPRQDQFQPWETCMTINNTWAYRPKDREFKSAETLIRDLVEIIGRGGNFLLDVGPQPDGRILTEFAERLEAVGKWVHANEEAIYGSTYGPVQGQNGFRTTARESKTYVFVMNSSAATIEIKGANTRVGNVRHIATGNSVPFQQAEDVIRVSISQQLWSTGLPVLELRVKGE